MKSEGELWECKALQCKIESTLDIFFKKMKLEKDEPEGKGMLNNVTAKSNTPKLMFNVE